MQQLQSDLTLPHKGKSLLPIRLALLLNDVRHNSGLCNIVLVSGLESFTRLDVVPSPMNQCKTCSHNNHKSVILPNCFKTHVEFKQSPSPSPQVAAETVTGDHCGPAGSSQLPCTLR